MFASSYFVHMLTKITGAGDNVKRHPEAFHFYLIKRRKYNIVLFRD